MSASNAVYFNPSSGTLYAVSKSFRINHPTKEGKKKKEAERKRENNEQQKYKGKKRRKKINK